MKKSFLVYTQHDGKDHRSVEQIYYYDENGDEIFDKYVTELCIDISTCADQGIDTWHWIKNQIETRLIKANITYEDIIFEE
ncbi:bacillopeptidase F (M6 metalloprotease family) [Pseudomonas sp. TE6283]